MYKSLNPGAIGVSVPFEEEARLASKYKFDCLRISSMILQERGPESVARTLSEHGLKPGPLDFPVAFRGDEEKFRASLQGLDAIARSAAQLGCRRCATYISSWSDERDFAANFAFHRDRLRPAAEILARHGISLGLEFLGPKTLRTGHRFEFIHTMEGMLELAAAIGTGNVGLLLDCWHLYTSGGTNADIEKLGPDAVVDVHVNDAPAGIPVDEQIDNVRCLPGETGVIDVPGFLRALKKIGYEGNVTVEPFSARVRAMPPDEAVRVTAESLHKVWRDAGL